MNRVNASLTLLLLVASGAGGQELKTIRIKARPAAEPVPALKYPLLPDLGDLRPGNAALAYERAHAPEYFNYVRRLPDYQKLPDWLELPLDKLPVNKARALLPRQLLSDVDLGARREQCDWELTHRVRKEGMFLLMGNFQTFREYAQLLAVRARLEMLEGRLDKAIYSLQTGFALGRHTAEAPTLITALIGIATAHIMLDQVELLIQRQSAPNLYWSLTELPRPFIHLRKGFQSERIMVDGMFPAARAALTNTRSGPFSADQLQDSMDKLDQVFSTAGGDYSNRLLVAVGAAKVYPQARSFLLSQGRTPTQVDALPVLQVALMYALVQYDIQFDNSFKWQNLPYWEAAPGVRRAEAALCTSKARLLETGGIPLAETLLPATTRVMFTRARLDRRIAALACVEAIRLHAAAHQGKLPAALAEITGVPIPRDPMTGQAFAYQLRGDTAELLCQPSSARAGDGFRYEITLHGNTDRK